MNVSIENAKRFGEYVSFEVRGGTWYSLSSAIISCFFSLMLIKESSSEEKVTEQTQQDVTKDGRNENKTVQNSINQLDNNRSYIQELKELHELYEKRVIPKEIYDEEREKILNKRE